MNKKILFIAIIACTFQTWAMPVLYDWGFNINGTVLTPDMPLTNQIDDTQFDWDLGLGTLSLDFNPGTPGDYSILSFYDHELDQTANTFFNECGSISSTPQNGLVWEIDEPGYLFGDIYDNYLAGGYDNTNSINSDEPNDVSMGMGWRFSLADGQSANIRFSLFDYAPMQGFYLMQTDMESNSSIYLSSSLTILGGHPPVNVPEPASAGLLAIGVIGIIAIGLKRTVK